MFKAQKLRPIFLCLSLSLTAGWLAGQAVMLPLSWQQSAQAEADKKATADKQPGTAQAITTLLPVKKDISIKGLEKYKTISIIAREHGEEVNYSGVPLRDMLPEMIPELKIETEKDWKAITPLELVMEIKGADGYVGLVTVPELAFNTGGDRYVLATQQEGKPSADGVHLICKMDEARIRWVKEVVSLQIRSLSKQ